MESRIGSQAATSSGVRITAAMRLLVMTGR
jgi:hypothetical protein